MSNLIQVIDWSILPKIYISVHKGPVYLSKGRLNTSSQQNSKSAHYFIISVYTYSYFIFLLNYTFYYNKHIQKQCLGCIKNPIRFNLFISVKCYTKNVVRRSLNRLVVYTETITYAKTELQVCHKYVNSSRPNGSVPFSSYYYTQFHSNKSIYWFCFGRITTI